MLWNSIHLGNAIVVLFALLSTPVQAEVSLVAYHAVEDVVYGYKDGLPLTLDVVDPVAGRNGKELNGFSSGSWISKKSDNLDEEEDHCGPY